MPGYYPLIVRRSGKNPLYTSSSQTKIRRKCFTLRRLLHSSDALFMAPRSLRSRPEITAPTSDAPIPSPVSLYQMYRFRYRILFTGAPIRAPDSLSLFTSRLGKTACKRRKSSHLPSLGQPKRGNGERHGAQEKTQSAGNANFPIWDIMVTIYDPARKAGTK